MKKVSLCFALCAVLSAAGYAQEWSPWTKGGMIARNWPPATAEVVKTLPACAGTPGLQELPADQFADLGAGVMETDAAAYEKAAGKASKQQLCNWGMAILKMPGGKACRQYWATHKHTLTKECVAAAKKWALTHSYPECRPGAGSCRKGYHLSKGHCCPNGYYYIGNNRCQAAGGGDGGGGGGNGGGGGGYQDPCAGVWCNSGYHCQSGQCVKDYDPCDGAGCPYGTHPVPAGMSCQCMPD